MAAATAGLLYVIGGVRVALGSDPSTVPLPEGVKAVWDMGKAYRETTPTRERISINGLWRWQPAEEHGRPAAGRELGLFQGPRLLAGNQRLHAEGLPDGLSPIRAGRREQLAGVAAAWYQREISVPEGVGRPPHRPLPSNT